MARPKKDDTAKKDLKGIKFDDAQAYADENGLNVEDIDKFFSIAQKYDVLTENDKKIIAEQAKFYLLKEDEDLTVVKKKDTHKISANDVVYSEEGYREAKMELYILKTWKQGKCTGNMWSG